MSIARFADGSGRVCVCDLVHQKTRRAKPDDALFVAKRAWDQRAEDGMKRIEDAFQELAAQIIDRTVSHIGDAHKVVVNRFSALWYERARHRHLSTQEVQANGIIGGGNLTRDQEEFFEKKGYGFMRSGGRWPARQLNGVRIQTLINCQIKALSSTKWGIIQAHEGEFLVPDVSLPTVLPLTPTLCLMSPAPDGMILKQDVAMINRSIRAATCEYFFARDLSQCPY